MQTKKNRKLLLSIIFSAVFILVVAFAFGIIFLSDKNEAKTVRVEGTSVSTTDPIGDKDLLVYLGDEKAKNEILLVFDYSCPYCHQWTQEIYPAVDEFITNGDVKFRTQSMVFLNETSLKLAELDQNLKRNYPGYYFDVFFTLMSSDMNEDWATDTYLNHLITEYELNRDTLFKEPQFDAINVTRKYTKALEIDAVPAVFVNGNRVENPFSLEEIHSLLK